MDLQPADVLGIRRVEPSYLACSQADPGFGTLSGTEQVTCMIGWLMNSYPVPRELLEERRGKSERSAAAGVMLYNERRMQSRLEAIIMLVRVG